MTGFVYFLTIFASILCTKVHARPEEMTLFRSEPARLEDVRVVPYVLDVVSEDNEEEWMFEMEREDEPDNLANIMYFMEDFPDYFFDGMESGTKVVHLFNVNIRRSPEHAGGVVEYIPGKTWYKLKEKIRVQQNQIISAASSLRRGRKYAHDENNRNLQIDYNSRVPAGSRIMKGTFKVLVIRGSGSDIEPAQTVESLKEYMWGIGGGPDYFVTQYSRCSNGTLILEPAVHPDIDEGVLDVQVNKTFYGLSRTQAVNDVVAEAQRMIGNFDDGFVDFAMVVMPRDINYFGSSVAGFATLNGRVSAYKNNLATKLALQMHELGHNFGMEHSNYASSNTDFTDYLATSDPILESRICFNAAKSWKFGWYDQYHVLVDMGTTTSWDGRLSTIANFNAGTIGAEEKMIVRISEPSGYDVLLMFNRKAFPNDNVNVFVDKVTIVQLLLSQVQGSGGLLAHKTDLKAGLDVNEEYRFAEFSGTGSGNDLVIQVCDITVGTTQDNAHVIVYKDDGSTPVPSCTSDTTTSSEPSLSPSGTPSWSPSRLASLVPSFSLVPSSHPSSCSSDADCDDAIPCTIDTCIDGVCTNVDKICDNMMAVCEIGLCNAATGDCEFIQDPVCEPSAEPSMAPSTTPSTTPSSMPISTPSSSPSAAPIVPVPCEAVCGNGICEDTEDCLSCDLDCNGKFKREVLSECCYGGPADGNIESDIGSATLLSCLSGSCDAHGNTCDRGPLQCQGPPPPPPPPPAPSSSPSTSPSAAPTFPEPTTTPSVAPSIEPTLSMEPSAAPVDGGGGTTCTTDGDCSAVDTDICTETTCNVGLGECETTPLTSSPTSCGNGICEYNENCENCRQDCSRDWSKNGADATYCCYGGGTTPTGLTSKYATNPVGCGDSRCTSNGLSCTFDDYSVCGL